MGLLNLIGIVFLLCLGTAFFLTAVVSLTQSVKEPKMKRVSLVTTLLSAITFFITFALIFSRI